MNNYAQRERERERESESVCVFVSLKRSSVEQGDRVSYRIDLPRGCVGVGPRDLKICLRLLLLAHLSL